MPTPDNAAHPGPTEQRRRQRIMVTQPGARAFWLLLPLGKIRLIDVSVAGFSFCDAWLPPVGEEFDFVIEREGESATLAGKARVAVSSPGQTGCEITSLDPAGQERLVAWLADHVRQVAAIPVRPEESAAIVRGPSIV